MVGIKLLLIKACDGVILSGHQEKLIQGRVFTRPKRQGEARGKGDGASERGNSG